jgi:hypothetical protein
MIGRIVRRGALALAVSILLVLGFGAAYALSGGLNGEALLGALTGGGHTPVVICHKPGTDAEHSIIVDDDDVAAHMDHGDYFGRCQATEPTEPQVTTLTSETTTTAPVTDTVPPTTVTLPPETATTVITDTVTVPPATITVPETTTIVTVPPASTETVTLPGQTVTQPPVTQTLPGQTIERQPETVTLPGATTTVTAAGTASVVTITGPHAVIVHPGLVVKTKVQAKIKKARRLVHFAARVRRIRARLRLLRTTLIVVVRQMVAGVSHQAKGCPAGTEPFNGTCRAVVRGKG